MTPQRSALFSKDKDYMIKICMAGACGRMGRRIIDLASLSEEFDVAGAFDVAENAGASIPAKDDKGVVCTITVGKDAAVEVSKADVLIDFTMAAACIENARIAADAQTPVVVGATGLRPDEVSVLRTCAQVIPVVYAPNMSVGVNLLFKLTQEVAALLGLEYNVEIVETHHNLKKDSPSGTAVRLAECAAEALGLKYPGDAVFGREGLIGERPQGQIGVHALRGGDVVGEHTVLFIGEGERIELTHRAHNRDNFARGALRAALFAAKAVPGLYDMQDVLGLK
jgi:4-hydroxy-tetrahydrodipicolinate reductase